MKVARKGTDYLEIDEQSLSNDKPDVRVHLIKFNFSDPTTEKINTVLKKYTETNRFVVDSDIKFYNNILKTLNKKYYIENNETQKIITFFKRNNKVLLNFDLLSADELLYVINNLDDVLSNVEVIRLSKELFNEIKDELTEWNGNVIL